MVTPSFVMAAYSVKDDVTRRNVNFRQTKLRYLVVVIAIFVVFGCEYCFDNPSVRPMVIFCRLCRRRSRRIILKHTRERYLAKHNSIYYTHYTHSPTSSYPSSAVC